MTTLRFIIEGDPNGPLPYDEHVFQLPGAGDGVRLLEWAMAPEVYGYPMVEVIDEQEVKRDPTKQEVLSRFWDDMVRATVAQMVQRENRLRKEAVQPVPEPDIQEL